MTIRCYQCDKIIATNEPKYQLYIGCWVCERCKKPVNEGV